MIKKNDYTEKKLFWNILLTIVQKAKPCKLNNTYSTMVYMYAHVVGYNNNHTLLTIIICDGSPGWMVVC